MWVGKGGKDYSAPPPVKLDDFMTAWDNWYHDLQPEERLVKGRKSFSYSRNVEQVNWTKLRKGGPQGFFLLLVSLVFWVKSRVQNSLSTKRYQAAFSDVAWVLDSMVKNMRDGKSA